MAYPQVAAITIISRGQVQAVVLVADAGAEDIAESPLQLERGKIQRTLVMVKIAAKYMDPGSQSCLFAEKHRTVQANDR